MGRGGNAAKTGKAEADAATGKIAVQTAMSVPAAAAAVDGEHRPCTQQATATLVMARTERGANTPPTQAGFPGAHGALQRAQAGRMAWPRCQKSTVMSHASSSALPLARSESNEPTALVTQSKTCAAAHPTAQRLAQLRSLLQGARTPP